MDFKIRQRHCNRIWYRYVWRNEWKGLVASLLFCQNPSLTVREIHVLSWESVYGHNMYWTILPPYMKLSRNWKRIIPHWCSPHAQRFSFHSSPGYYRWNRKYSGSGISGREFKHTRRKRIPSDDQFSTIWLSVSYQWLLERNRRIANAAGYKPFQRPLCACLFYIHAIPQTPDAKIAVPSVLSVMRNVSVPFGITTPDKPHISSTRWRSVSDQKNKIYYFESVMTPNLFWLDLKKSTLVPKPESRNCLSPTERFMQGMP